MNNLQITIAKTHTLNVDFEAFSDDVKAFVINYGVKQLLNDAAASGKGAEEKLGMAQKKLDRLVNGEITLQRASALDDVTKEARVIARDLVRRELAKKGQSLKDIDKTVLQKLIIQVAMESEITDEAAKRIAARSAAPNVDIDLTSLLEDAA